MSKKPPLSPILKAMRENLHDNVKGMHDELKKLDTFIAAKNLITNNRPVAQALVDAFEAARAAPAEDPLAGFKKAIEVAGPGPSMFEPSDEARTIFFTVESIERMLNGVPVTGLKGFRFQMDPHIEPMSFKVVSADTPIIAADPETPEEIEEHRAEVIETIQEARGQEPEAFKPDPEDPVDDIAYEVETMSEEDATASIEEPYEAELVMPRRDEPKRLVPREVPEPRMVQKPTDAQAEVDEKLTSHLEVATKRSGTDQMLFDRATLAKLIHESEVRLGASLNRLAGRGVITLNPGALKGDVSFTFNGRK